MAANMVAKNVTINGTRYSLGKLDFRAIAQLEEHGYSLFDLLRKRATMVNGLALACVSHAMDIDRDEAVDIVEEHLEHGGKLNALIEAFSGLLEESEYFTAAFAQDVDVHAGAKAKQATTQAKAVAAIQS